MKFVIDVTLSEAGKEEMPDVVADNLLDYLCQEDEVSEIQSYDGIDWVRGT